MELIFTVAFVALFAYISYTMAENRGRNGPWAIAGSLLLSPIAVWIYMFIAGDTEEMKAKKLKELKDLING